MTTFIVRELTCKCCITIPYKDELVDESALEIEFRKRFEHLCYAKELYILRLRLQNAYSINIETTTYYKTLDVTIPIDAHLSGINFPQCEFVLLHNKIINSDDPNFVILQNDKYHGLSIRIKKTGILNILINNHVSHFPVKVIDAQHIIDGPGSARLYVDQSEFITAGSLIFHSDDSAYYWKITEEGESRWNEEIEYFKKHIAIMTEIILGSEYEKLYGKLYPVKGKLTLKHQDFPIAVPTDDLVNVLEMNIKLIDRSKYLRRPTGVPLWVPLFKVEEICANRRPIRKTLREFQYLVYEKIYYSLCSFLELKKIDDDLLYETLWTYQDTYKASV